MKRIVIIGGGIAGLSAGIFARRNGFESIIVEKNHDLGGECTGWDRAGYHVDGCIHWLVGTKEGTALRDLWNNVGALDGVEIYHPESFMTVEHSGIKVHFYKDIDRLQASWREISPEDEKAIHDFCNDIRRLHSFSIPCGKPMDLMNLFEKTKLMLSLKDAAMILQKYEKITVGQLAQRFKHPALKTAIASFVPEGNFSAISVIFPLGTFTSGQASIPMGGSRALARRMENRYVSLGGAVKTGWEAADMLIRNHRVVNMESVTGNLIEGDYYVAACDANVLFNDLLKGRYPDGEYEKRFNDPVTYPLASNIYIAIGYAGSIVDIPRTIKFPVEGLEVEQNQEPVTHLQMTHYGYEPDFAPEGHSVVTFAINQFESELKKWEDLATDRDAYQNEKMRIGAQVVAAMERRFPQMKGKCTVLDIATPQTYVRFCNAYRGAFMGFWPTVTGKALNHTGQISQIENLYLTGQWLQPPGGLPVAVITGKDTLMRICKKEKQEFKLYSE